MLSIWFSSSYMGNMDISDTYYDELDTEQVPLRVLESLYLVRSRGLQNLEPQLWRTLDRTFHPDCRISIIQNDGFKVRQNPTDSYFLRYHA